jgi:hypothetical protein
VRFKLVVGARAEGPRDLVLVCEPAAAGGGRDASAGGKQPEHSRRAR